MTEILFIISFVISFGAVAAVILVTHQLQGDYKSDFINNYFYYLIAFLAFGFYASWAQIILRSLMAGFELPSNVIERVGQLLPVLGFPFILIAWLMQLRMMYAFRSQKLKSVYSLLYFVIFLVLLIVIYVFFSFTDFDPGESLDLRVFVISSLIGIDLLISLLSIWIGLFAVKSIRDRQKKKIYFKLTGYLALSILIRYSLAPVMFIHPLMVSGFLLLFFTSFLIPLIFLRSIADDLFPSRSIEGNVEIDFKILKAKYQISKRETEIIDQICQGKSNKQIAETLFISLQTVKDHTHRIYTKVGINSRMQLLQKVNRS
ncbi:response regulator transcription factor [Bacteroidota bacterium]